VVQNKDVLGGLPIDVMVFNAGNPALAWASVNHVDAVILDLMMPKMDGFEVLKELRNLENTRTVPVLILTAKHITADELRFLKGNHISQLIQKGDVNRIELLQSVKQMVYPTKQLTDDARVSNTDTSEKPLLLVVEDNLDNLLTVKALLADSYEVIEANNGLEAVAKARTQRPDLILMDIALPEMDGIEAFKIIHKDAVSQHIPIIALTASAMTSDRETILAYGFDAYIAKPIDETHFFNTINATLYGK
jgi:CheY-like chemotaxis protein